jgi:hypothetical protein
MIIIRSWPTNGPHGEGVLPSVSVLGECMLNTQASHVWGLYRGTQGVWPVLAVRRDCMDYCYSIGSTTEHVVTVAFRTDAARVTAFMWNQIPTRNGSDEEGARRQIGVYGSYTRRVV